MKQYFNKCTLYMFLWVIYYLQGTFYAGGSIISQGIFAILIVWTLFIWVKVCFEQKLPLFLKILNIFLLMIIIYGLLCVMDPNQIYYQGIYTTPIYKFGDMRYVFLSLFPIYVFYYYTLNRQLTTNVICLFSVIWFVVAIYFYYKNQNEILAAYAENGFSGDEEITNNMAYNFVHLLPLMFFWNKKPLIQYLFVFALFAFIISGMKRGAILTGAICFIWFLYGSFKSSRGKMRMLIVALSVIILFIGTNYVMDMYENSLYFQQRVDQTIEGNSSDRDFLYSSLINGFKENISISLLVFGGGAYYTIAVIGEFAHNDWIELLLNHGLIGVSIYVLYFISLGKTILRCKNNKTFFNILFMTVMIMFMTSIFSMSYNSLTLPIVLSLGYCLAHIYHSKLDNSEVNNSQCFQV